MAEIVLSALLPVLFEKLTSAALKTIDSYNGIDSKIKKCHRSLLQIQNVLTDASHKEITDQSVKRWLNGLQHLAYDIDDALDELATDDMDREYSQQSKTITSKVRKLISTRSANFSRSISVRDKLDNVSERLKVLVEERDALGLRVVGDDISLRNKSRKFQTSLFDESKIVGRGDEKEAWVRKLLGSESCDRNFSVVPIVGMGGVGKTTLARLLYDEKRVKDHFELRVWVCVSDDFDSFGVSKVVFQSVTEENKDFADLNLLQVALRDHLRGKRILLVLDDVWSESCEDWETLVGPFHVCAPGSKIIITTRKNNLLRMLGCNHLNQLKSLSYEHAVSLIALHALGVDNFDSHLTLKPYGEGIAKKCDGLPLALKALGRLLSMKKDEEEYWKKVLDSDIWNLPVERDIVPALKLSYHDLPARLKQLFAYCSLFPKDYVFDKEELVLLWMGEGFLHQSPPSDLTEESMGYEYFDELLSRSFFQHAPNNDSLFVMHDMMNDLATLVASEFFVRLDIEAKRDIGKEMLERYRHMSFVREEYVTSKKFETFTRANSLRTFLAACVAEVESWQSFYLSDKVLANLLHELPLLRVLSLSNFEISEVPESIGTLRHLRYLNLSRTAITSLPENVCNLYNLQTLIVYGCRCLANFPNNFLKLKNLRHLDIRDTPLLDRMPLGIDELKSLQTLSKIIIGGKSVFEISKLKEFKNLCGKISIVGLDKVQNATHARVANFSQRRLSELEVVWSDVWDGSRNVMLEKEVLNELKPCNDKLIQLKIRSYGGLELPKWVGDPSFRRLKHVSIRGCKKCTSLPPLEQLPSLKELFVEGLEGVTVVGMELFGTGLKCPSLEILSFVDMSGWRKWSTIGEDVFPCLQQLHIRDCPKLVEVSIASLPSLNVLETSGCASGLLRRLVQVASSVNKLDIARILGLNDVVWRGVIKYLVAVEELSITGCDEIRYLWESEVVASKVLVNLKKLKVSSCNNLMSLGEEEEDSCKSNLLESLTMLNVSHCNNMKYCNCPVGIERLIVYNCISMTYISLPKRGQKLKTLYISGCKELLEKELGGENINNTGSMPMLEVLDICDWPNLKSITGLNYMDHLTTLKIINCERLESFPHNELSNLTLLKCLHITNCPSMDVCFPHGVWPPKLHSLTIGKLKKPILEWGQQNLPTSIVELYLHGDDGVRSCSQFSHLLPSSITHLEIIAFGKLKSFSTGLQHLTSLQHLGVYDCPNMMDLPEVLLPSVLSLRIRNCPKLKKRCSKRGSYWPLIWHIPRLLM